MRPRFRKQLEMTEEDIFSRPEKETELRVCERVTFASILLLQNKKRRCISCNAKLKTRLFEWQRLRKPLPADRANETAEKGAQVLLLLLMRMMNEIEGLCETQRLYGCRATTHLHACEKAEAFFFWWNLKSK